MGRHAGAGDRRGAAAGRGGRRDGRGARRADAAARRRRGRRGRRRRRVAGRGRQPLCGGWGGCGERREGAGWGERARRAPTLALPPGATALDLATTLDVAAALATRALFAGTVSVQTRRALGLGSTFAPRWAVAAPRFPHARPGAPPLVRRTLALYAPGGADAACKAWLDGAPRPGPDARVRGVALELHPTHARPPGDAAWKRVGPGRGYALAVRPADGSRAAAASLAALVAAVAGDPPPEPPQPDDDVDVARRLQAQFDAEAAGGGVAPAPTRPPSPPRVCPAPAGRPPSAASAPVLPLLSSPGDGTSWGRGPSPERQVAATGAVAAAPAPAAPLPPPPPPSAPRDECVVCMAAPAGAGFVHGDSMHVCCCAPCARAVERAAAAGGGAAPECPMCRAPVDRVVLHVFSS